MMPSEREEGANHAGVTGGVQGDFYRPVGGLKVRGSGVAKAGASRRRPTDLEGVAEVADFLAVLGPETHDVCRTDGRGGDHDRDLKDAHRLALAGAGAVDGNPER